jgi:hypothetical protein
MTQNKQQNSTEAMGPEIAAMLKQYPALAEAARHGVDIPLLLDNLKLSVSERIARLQANVNTIQQFQEDIQEQMDKNK